MPRTRTYGLDVDTIAYAARVKAGSGVTILPEPLKQLNRFIVGIKKLGLWNSMVCWPMRSIHNAGTGSTVYSLGGLGVNNATITSIIEWDFNGLKTVDIVATNSRVDTTFRIVTQSDFPITIFTVNTKNAPGSSNSRTICQIGLTGDSINLLRSGGTTTDGYRITVTGMTDLAISPSLGEPHSIHSIIKRGNVSFNIDFGTTLSNTPALSTFTTGTGIRFSNGSPTGTGNSIQSVLMIFLKNEVNQRIIHDLYKRTIGQGIKVVY
jgi:hypothetical protein